MSDKEHQDYYKLKYWQKQYQRCRPQQNKLSHKKTKSNSCLKFDNLYNKLRKSKAKKTQHSISSSFSQSSQSQVISRKTEKHCCNKKRRLIEQSQQIQRLKNKKKTEKQYKKIAFTNDCICGYKLSECPLIQHYLKKIQNQIKNQNNKRLALQRQNKQLVRENKFFNQYYQTFQYKIKQKENLDKGKSKISIKCSKSLKPDYQQADYWTFQKLISSPRNQNAKSPYQEGYQQSKYYKNEQPSQITRSSYHKNQHQNSYIKLNRSKNQHCYKKNG